MHDVAYLEPAEQVAPHGAWDPVCARPRDLVWPRRVGRAGVPGLTWRVASGPTYERLGRGLYAPRDRPASVEQRIVDVGARLPSDGTGGCVTGWAALRWRGATYFDGREAHGEGVVPVELVMGQRGHLASGADVVVRRRGLAPGEWEVVDGLPVATVQRALFDEVRRRDELWQAVVAIDMSAAAGLISAWLFATYLAEANASEGVPLARRAVALAVDESRSPRESWLRLVWLLVADLPPPLVNTPVFSLGGRFLGAPDLLDPVRGLGVEYAGAIHLDARRRQEDLVREEGLRRHGLEYVEVARGDSRRGAARRILAARGRSAWVPEDRRRWTVVPPAWWPVPESLDARLVRTGAARALTRH